MSDAVPKLLSGGTVTPDDYFMMFEVDRDNPLYTKPKYYIFFKGYGTSADLEKIRNAGNNPTMENSTVAVFTVPHR